MSDNSEFSRITKIMCNWFNYSRFAYANSESICPDMPSLHDEELKGLAEYMLFIIGKIQFQANSEDSDLNREMSSVHDDISLIAKYSNLALPPIDLTGSLVIFLLEVHGSDLLIENTAPEVIYKSAVAITNAAIKGEYPDYLNDRLIIAKSDQRTMYENKVTKLNSPLMIV